ncbi:MAG: flagellar protein FlaG [Dehalococcoidia bacterium]
MDILRIGPVDPVRAAGFRPEGVSALGDPAPQARRQQRGAPPRPVEHEREDQQNPDDAPLRMAYSYDESADRYVMRLIDADSGKVIRQVPTQELLRVAAEINRYLGVMLDKKS